MVFGLIGFSPLVWAGEPAVLAGLLNKYPVMLSVNSNYTEQTLLLLRLEQQQGGLSVCYNLLQQTRKKLTSPLLPRVWGIFLAARYIVQHLLLHKLDKQRKPINRLQISAEIMWCPLPLSLADYLDNSTHFRSTWRDVQPWGSHIMSGHFERVGRERMLGGVESVGLQCPDCQLWASHHWSQSPSPQSTETDWQLSWSPSTGLDWTGVDWTGFLCAGSSIWLVLQAVTREQHEMTNE